MDTTMLSLFVVLTLLSAVSFVCFASGYLLSPQMKQEFERYGIGRFRHLVAGLQLIGAVAQLMGLVYPPLAIIAAGGLMLMMLVAIFVRFKIGDTLGQTIPAAAYLSANLYLLLASFHR